jgi:hypothetical protein
MKHICSRSGTLQAWQANERARHRVCWLSRSLVTGYVLHLTCSILGLDLWQDQQRAGLQTRSAVLRSGWTPKIADRTNSNPDLFLVSCSLARNLPQYMCTVHGSNLQVTTQCIFLPSNYPCHSGRVTSCAHSLLQTKHEKQPRLTFLSSLELRHVTLISEVVFVTTF